MAVTVAQFRADFPAFADATAYPDAQITFWLNVAPQLVGDNWGSAQDQGTELFVAHNLSLGPVGVAGGGVTGGGVGGIVSSKSIKDVSVSYDTKTGTDDMAGFYNATIYGRQYWQLRKLFGKGVLQLTGSAPVSWGQGASIYPIPGW